MLAAGDVRLFDRLAQVVQVKAHCRSGQLSGPVTRGRVERDVDALKAMMLQLLLQQGAKPLVEVRQRRVERHIDYEPHGDSRKEIVLRISTLPTSCSDRGVATRCYRLSLPLVVKTRDPARS